jgi:hypothetical protein
VLSIPCDERYYGVVAMTPQKFKDETLRALVVFSRQLAGDIGAPSAGARLNDETANSSPHVRLFG